MVFRIATALLSYFSHTVHTSTAIVSGIALSQPCRLLVVVCHSCTTYTHFFFALYSVSNRFIMVSNVSDFFPSSSKSFFVDSSILMLAISINHTLY